MPELMRRFVFPREGWVSGILIMVMLLALAWSVQHAGWFDPMSFVVPVAYLAALTGAILGLTRLSVVIVLPLSALVGTWVVLWTVGGAFFPTLDQTNQLLVLRGEALDWGRIVFEGGFAPQLSPYAAGLGALMWVTAFMATYTLYRHHRVLDSILLVGVTLIANMWATLAEPELLFGFLLLFSLAALLLWLRVALISREESWRTRTVTETLGVPGQIMRSGVTFIFASIALAWILTSVAVAAPLTGVWSNLDGIWSSVRDQFEGAFSGLSGADSRIQGTSFGATFRVHGKWDSSDAAVMTVAAQKAYYMRAVTYDIYTGHGWTSSKGSDRQVAPGDLIFPGYTPERPAKASFKVETVEIKIQGSVARNVFTPGFATAAYLPLEIHQPGGRPLVGALQSTVSLDAGKGYQITADISTATEAMLAGAGQDYPAEISATYLSKAGITNRTATLARKVVDAARATDPYHEAKALADYLRLDARFAYTTVGTLPPAGSGQDLVDFFLFDPNGQRGYCEYYASAMAAMARTLGLPSRVAVGYAPSEQIKPGVYQYRRRNAHAWTEIFFPGYGWQSFEATHSIAAITRAAGEGTFLPPPPIDRGTDPGNEFGEGKNLGDVSSLPSFEPVPGGMTAGGQRPNDASRNNNATILIAFLGLLGLYAIWRVMRIRYRYRFLAPGDREWQRLAFAGDRAGIAQRPAETFYEYASWLEEQLPARQAEIHQIADGKVWQSYSGRSISAEAIARLKLAWGKLQLPMLWLALRSRVRGLLRGGRS